MNFITSDLHFGHEDIIGEAGFCSRTRGHFKSVEEMNQYLIEAHNSVVGENDTVYHLGDFSLNLTREEVFEILEQLNGQIHFIKGNHDRSRIMNYIERNNYKVSKNKMKYVTHDVGTIVKFNKRIYHLTHYPLQLGGWNQLRSLCGHIHDKTAELPYVMNVGVDSPELPEEHPFGVPIRFSAACKLLEKKFEKSIDIEK